MILKLKETYMSPSSYTSPAQPYFQRSAHELLFDDYDYGSDEPFYMPTESQGIVYAFIAAFLGWFFRGVGGTISNIEWSKIAKKMAGFVCSESLSAENKKLHREVGEYKELLKTIIHNPEARDEATGIFIESRTGPGKGDTGDSPAVPKYSSSKPTSNQPIARSGKRR